MKTVHRVKNPVMDNCILSDCLCLHVQNWSIETQSRGVVAMANGNAMWMLMSLGSLCRVMRIFQSQRLAIVFCIVVNSLKIHLLK